MTAAVTRDYERADVMLVGVSRSGKTPTCLYMALQYGIFAANYPLTEEEFESGALPASLAKRPAQAVRIDDRAGAAATDPQRAAARTAAMPRRRRCEFEVRAAEAIFRRYAIPCIDTTECSIEEIASRILDKTGLERRLRP